MNIDRLCELVESALNSDRDVMEWREGGLHVEVSWKAGDDAVRSVDPALTPTSDGIIVSNMFGQFHIHAEPGAPPFVSLGQTIKAGQRVALLEAMKAFCPVVADRAGRIVEILVEHGAEVELGQPLFRVA